jgi:hypothetical protein
VLFARDDRKFIQRNVTYEESDHHRYQLKYPYPRLYPREDASEEAIHGR